MKFATILAVAVSAVAAFPLEDRACPAPKSNKATVDLISEFEGFRADICE